MNSVHQHSAPERTNVHSGSTIRTVAQLNGFTWSCDSAAPQATTSFVSQDGAAQGEDQPRTLYSKLYERFIERREVFIHSNIDVRRNIAIDQAQTAQPQSQRQPNTSSPNPLVTTDYPVVAKIDSSPRDEDELLHGYWKFSNSSGPDYCSTGPSVVHAPVPIAEPSFPLVDRPSPPLLSLSHHQPLPARFHSSYSELSANVAFLCESKSQLTSSTRDSSRSGPSAHPMAQHKPRSRVPPPAEPSTSKRLDSVPQSRDPARRKNLTDGERRGASSSPRASGNKALSGKKGNDVRRQPSLACFFCRERKIACGRPAEGTTDRTCNQCARRAYPCDYPTESMRGQHKRRKTNKDGN